MRFPNVSSSSPSITPSSMSSSAASAPTYVMFFMRMRSREPSKFSTHMRASGTPRKVTSSRLSVSASGHVESWITQPPDRTSVMSRS